MKTAVEVAGPNLGGVRIDSGDLAALAQRVRNQLDALGATIAVNSLRSPSRTKRTFGTKSGSAATLHTSSARRRALSPV